MSQEMPSSATVERPPVDEPRVADELAVELERELADEARNRDAEGARMFTDVGAQMFTDV